MRQLIIVTLGLCLLPFGSALRGQDNTELLRTVRDLKSRMDRMDRENRDLRDRLENRDREVESMKATMERMDAENREILLEADEGQLERSIAAVTSRNFAPTVVHSVANPVTLTGEFRFRYYALEGADLNFVEDFTSEGISKGVEGQEESDGTWVDARIRLGFQYELSRDVTAFAELQAHWGFGNGAPTDGGYQTPFEGFFVYSHGETDTDVRLYQGWIEMRDVFGWDGFDMKGGRQEIVLGNQFQFGNADWYSGWSFDAVRADWGTDCWNLTALWITASSADFDRNQVPSIDRTHDDDELYALYFTMGLGKTHDLDLYWIYVNGHGGALDVGPKSAKPSVGSLGNGVGDVLDVNGTTAYFHTFGARIGGTLTGIGAGLDWNLEGAFQTGSQNVLSSGDLDVDGYAIEAEVGLTFGTQNPFRIFARGLYANGPSADGTGYIPLYPNRHSNGNIRARYGLFDLFPMTNVISVQGGFTWQVDPRWTLGAGIIWATTENDLVPTVPDTDDDYGLELDLWVEHRYSDQLFWGAGIAVLFPDDEGEFLWGLEDNTLAMLYIQARLLF